MSKTISALIENIEPNQLMVPVSTDTADEAYQAAFACAADRIKCVEVTFSVPGVDTFTSEVSSDSKLTVGTVTVLNLEDARNAIIAGASCMVSPNCAEEIIEFTKKKSLLSILGVCTPTEIFLAYKAGGDINKIFPFIQMGGLKCLEDIRGPLPFIKYMLASGVNLDNIREYLSARVSCILVGSSVIKREYAKAGVENDHFSGGRICSENCLVC